MEKNGARAVIMVCQVETARRFIGRHTCGAHISYIEDLTISDILYHIPVELIVLKFHKNHKNIVWKLRTSTRTSIPFKTIQNWERWLQTTGNVSYSDCWSYSSENQLSHWKKLNDVSMHRASHLTNIFVNISWKCRQSGNIISIFRHTQWIVILREMSFYVCQQLI